MEIDIVYVNRFKKRIIEFIDHEINISHSVKFDFYFLEQEDFEKIISGVFVEALSQTEIPRLHRKIRSFLNIIDSFEKGINTF